MIVKRLIIFFSSKVAKLSKMHSSKLAKAFGKGPQDGRPKVHEDIEVVQIFLQNRFN